MASTTYPGLPASPTLTNPDMILPYGEYDDSAPSPPQQAYRPAPGDDDWSSGGVANMQFSIGSAHSGMGSIPQATPIIYGNGTMLSDIGEVTEAESTVGRSRRLPGPAERRMLKQRQNSPLRTNPTVGYDAVMKRTKTGTHQRTISVDSTSTVRSEGHMAEVFRDFDDDAASVDDSVFQGDDEESVADSYTEGVIASETQRLAKVDDPDDGDENGTSSAALSRRAEQILQNAKLRLNNMEGNLTRARSSLATYPTNSNSSIHSSSPLTRSTPSPPTKLIPLQLGLPPSKRKIHTPMEMPSSPGHSRGFSENNLATNQYTSPNLIRSASAAARYGTPKYSPDSTRESLTGGSRGSLAAPLHRTATPLNGRLEPLNEDEPARLGSGKGSGKGSDRSSTEGNGSPGENPLGLTRSSSSMQVRDLKDQMHDLKGRLSVLRDRARDDTMKRRSLQSLRTPSPFTAAEQWYTGAKGYGEGHLSADAVVTYSPWQQSPISPKAESPEKLAAQLEYTDSEVTSVYEDVSEEVDDGKISHSAVLAREREIGGSEDGLGEENGVRYDTAVEDANGEEYANGDDYNDEIVDPKEAEDYESDASMYHDTYLTQLSHEDREDAFDYEHFFLHSAMGTISQQRHGRRGSYSSEDSVETTRGPPAASSAQSSDDRPALGHLRNDSNASVSTFATFATATEGYDEDDEDHDNFAVQEVSVPTHKTRSVSPPSTAKRSTFGSPINGLLNERRSSSPEKISRSGSVTHAPHGPNGHSRQASSLSQESLGTTRSFPLVNKPKSQSPPIASNNSIKNDGGNEERSSPVDMLQPDDQQLIEQVVAAVGKCVLGLQESGPTSYDAKVWRRRLDAARRVLEGEEEEI